MSDLAPVSAIICDEVRREASGDAIIIGARQSGPPVVEAEDQKPGRIAFYIEVETDFPPPQSIGMRLRNINDDEVVLEHTFKGSHDLPDELPEGFEARGILLMVYNEGVSPVTEPGIYALECRGDEKDWLTVRTILFPASEDHDGTEQP